MRFVRGISGLRLFVGLALAYALALAPVLGNLGQAAIASAGMEFCLHSGLASPADTPDLPGGTGHDCCTVACRVGAAAPPALVPAPGQSLLPHATAGMALVPARAVHHDDAPLGLALARGPPAVA